MNGNIKMVIEVKPNEGQPTFISRCIKEEMDKGKVKDNRQAYAICISKWTNRNKKKESK